MNLMPLMVQIKKCRMISQAIHNSLALKINQNMDDAKNLNDVWTARWNDRYSKDEFAYGEAPNNYLKEQLTKINVGKILFPAEGEGRNAVYAAKIGWTVSAFDIKKKKKNL